MRPRGSFGEVAAALRSAASQRPGTVAQLAERACVGYDAARYTASRLLSAGELVRVSDGRPSVLGAPRADERRGLEPQPLQVLHAQFWQSGPSSRNEPNEFADSF